MNDKGHSLHGTKISDDEAIGQVIKARAKVAELQKLVSALKKDRDELLTEYTDLQNLRPIQCVVPPAQKVKASKYKDRVRVTFGDMHGMRMDKQAVSALLADIKSLAPDEIVIGGDMLDCEGWLAKHHPIGFVAYNDYSYQDDIEAANWFLDELITAASKAQIHYLFGNHEDHVERTIVDTTAGNMRDAGMLMEAFGPEKVLRLNQRNIKFYRRNVVYEDNCPRGWIKLGKMYFTHELSSGKAAAQKAVERTAGNITYYHTHREDASTMVFPSVGLVKAFNPGCLCERQPMYRMSDPTSWSHGYGIDIISHTGNFQRIHIPIWQGESLAGSMIERFKS